MLTALADGGKVPLYMILNGRTMPEEQFPTGISVVYQPEGSMTAEFMKDWLPVV
jgi:hypothetical protein